MMGRAASFLLIGLAAATGAMAESGGKVPVTRDLEKWDRVEEALDRRAEETGSLPPRAFEPDGGPRVQSDPSGVAGFMGPPGTVGDSVGSYGALPQGITGSDIR